MSRASHFPMHNCRTYRFVRKVCGTMARRARFLCLFSRDKDSSGRVRRLCRCCGKGGGRCTIGARGRGSSKLCTRFLRSSSFSALRCAVPFRVLFIGTSEREKVSLGVPGSPRFRRCVKDGVKRWWSKQGELFRNGAFIWDL